MSDTSSGSGVRSLELKSLKPEPLHTPNSMLRTPNSYGFTLLEVLIAVAIMAGIVSVIYASFTTAANNVEHAEASRDATDLARVLISKVVTDCENAYYNPLMKEPTIFYGKQSEARQNEPRFDRIAMTTLTNWRRPDSKETDLWEVEYRFEDRPDSKKKMLIRREKRELGKEGEPVLEGGVELAVTDRVEQLRLRYLSGKTWFDEWDSRARGKLPDAIEVLLALENGPTFITQAKVGR